MSNPEFVKEYKVVFFGGRNEETEMLDVLDSTGQEEYATMREQYMCMGGESLLVYNITSYKYLHKVEDSIDSKIFGFEDLRDGIVFNSILLNMNIPWFNSQLNSNNFQAYNENLNELLLTILLKYFENRFEKCLNIKDIPNLTILNPNVSFKPDHWIEVYKMGILVFSASIQSEDDFNSITIKIGKEKALVLLDAYNNLWLRTSQCFPNSKNQLINSNRSLQNSLLLSKYTQNDPNTNSQYSRSSDFYDANSKLYYSKAEFFHKNNLSASGNFPKNNPETSQVFSEILDIVVGNNSFNRSAINNKHENSLKGSKSDDSIISENSIGSESDIYESSDSDSNLIDDQLSESHPIYTDLIEDAQNTQNIQNNSERNIGSSAKNVFPATTSGFDEDDGYANSSRNTSFESINDLMIGFDINGTDVSAIRNYTSRNLKSRKSDQFFGYLFYLNSIPEKVPDRDKILYFALVDILLIAAVFSILSAIVGWCWIKISKTNAKTLVWLTVIFVPVTCIMVAMNAGFNILFPGNQNGRKFEYEIWIRNVFVLTGSLFIAMKNILYLVVSQVAQDLRMIFDLGMFILSLFIFASFGFMVFISSLTIYMNPLTGFYSLGVDVLVWYIVSFVWITCVILQFHRAVSSSTIGQWYFHRHEPGDTGKWFFGQTSVYLALSDWFGTICLSGLIQMVAVIVTVYSETRSGFIKYTD
ncbi:hypothetical protein BB558_002142 [Smittium angustum]|uniref:Protein PNS1 n=1 Tax=Smittium angustum TaxID=133377 RepID=A0A2U1J9H7_SMIAN|nr:hypothetical protein BB558_002142 [Smittium angustum]